MKDAMIHARISARLLERLDKVLARKGLSRSEWLVSQVSKYVDEEEKQMAAIEITNEDLRKLGELTTRDEAGVHFTRRYSREWLDRMEEAGMIRIHKPVHPATKLEYSEEYWSAEVTLEGIAEGEARNWGE